GPRFRVLGSRAGYVKYGLDPQESALAEGLRPNADNAATPWGEEPENLWGRISHGDSDGGTPVRTLPGDYPAYYTAVAAALRHGGPAPVAVEEVVACLDVLEAARRSARDGVVVELPQSAG
ncbi:Gfo/Idh/MocA family oxidoreductase, partial [Streptomyces erythrochromogenes]|uniref:Gfo/Idh/MocA family oxidoreductase n=1 Tax=Streptomyces erythrochromogenes TaxID=285574 RepID=UPI00342A71F3